MIIDIPEEILNINLTIGAKLIYGVAKAHPSYENSLLSAMIGISDKQFNRYVLELEKAGLIKRKKGFINIVEVEDWQNEWNKLKSLQSQISYFK